MCEYVYILLCPLLHLTSSSPSTSLYILYSSFLNAAISPSVLVPSLLNLEDHGYGVDKGIPTMLIVSAAFDDVICISLFGVFLALVFQNGPLVFSIFRGPIEVVIGLLYGVGFGLTLWYVPSKDSVSVYAYIQVIHKRTHAHTHIVHILQYHTTQRHSCIMYERTLGVSSSAHTSLCSDQVCCMQWCQAGGQIEHIHGQHTQAPFFMHPVIDCLTSYLPPSFPSPSLLLSPFLPPFPPPPFLPPLYPPSPPLSLPPSLLPHQKKGSIVRNRLTLLVGLALFAFFGAKRMVFYNNPGFIGAGALSILTVAFVASIGWKRGRSTKHIIDRTFFILWQFIEPLLFGLIGAEVNIAAIDGKVVGEWVGGQVTGERVVYI